jgi:MaoC like domain
MAVREPTAPGTLALLAKVVAPLVPGASRLPFVAGGGGEMPGTELELGDVEIDREHLAAYVKVCGFTLRDALPATYPHVLAFPLHLALMTDGRFPFAAVGLVHIANRITQHRPIGSGERLALRVSATAPEPHARGSAFSLVSEVRVGGELAWEGLSTNLSRAAGGGEEPKRATGAARRAEPPPAVAAWRLGGDLGRRYAAVSGDRNPIHLSGPTAKLFGFPRTIVHGMWTKARCLAALESRLADAFAVEVEFRRPILLPSRVAFASAAEGTAIRFAVRDAETGAPHLDGNVDGTAP